MWQTSRKRHTFWRRLCSPDLFLRISVIRSHYRRTNFELLRNICCDIYTIKYICHIKIILKLKVIKRFCLLSRRSAKTLIKWDYGNFARKSQLKSLLVQVIMKLNQSHCKLFTSIIRILEQDLSLYHRYWGKRERPVNQSQWKLLWY